MMRKLDNRQVDSKRLDNKKLDNKRLDNKKIDNKKLILLSLSLILIAFFMILNRKHESLVLALSENTDDIEIVREEIRELVDGRTVLCKSSKLRSVFTEKHSGIFVKTFYSNTDKQNCEGYICICDQRQFMNSTSRLRTRVVFFKLSNFLNSEEHDEKTILNDYVKITRIASGDVTYDSALDSFDFGDYKLNQNASNYVFDLKFENIGETESSNVKSNLILEFCF